jgi:hypothetical protein
VNTLGLTEVLRLVTPTTQSPHVTETVKGIVPLYSTVQNKECLGKGGVNQNSISVGIGEEEVYTG